jgi:hypothetical protein
MIVRGLVRGLRGGDFGSFAQAQRFAFQAQTAPNT